MAVKTVVEMENKKLEITHSTLNNFCIHVNNKSCMNWRPSLTRNAQSASTEHYRQFLAHSVDPCYHVVHGHHRYFQDLYGITNHYSMCTKI